MIRLDDRIDPDALYWTADVAELVFARRVEWFYSHRAKLHAEGFPQPISNIGRRRWTGRALIEWCNRPPGTQAPATPGEEGAALSNILNLRAHAMFANRPPAKRGPKR